jgi:hypothetical protein
MRVLILARDLQPSGAPPAAIAAIAAALLGGCVVPAPLFDPVVFDSPPFYFPEGVQPSTAQDVVLDLAALESQSFGLDVFEWDPNDVLLYRWTFQSRDFEGELGSGELNAPTAVGDVWVHQVESVTINTCGQFLRAEGDVVTLRLDVSDPIAPGQVFDPAATEYGFRVVWRVVGSGECP